MDNDDLARSIPLFIKIWFSLDFILCCAPPIYLACGTSGGMSALPISILYFVLCGTFVTLSIIAAEFVEA